MNTDVRNNVALLNKAILFPQSLHGSVQISFQKNLLVFTTLQVSVVNLSYRECIKYIIKYNLKITDNDNHFFFFGGRGVSQHIIHECSYTCTHFINDPIPDA